ncbi:hypothetical protein [Persicitalea sp.]|uniref:hypothetical protein n=1 Tax=Persicitalea sp. TaxID=3100273 RepID=UPI0035943C98
MKTPSTFFIAALVLLLAQRPAMAQNSLAQQTRVEVSLGVATPSLGRGAELLRAKALRQSGLSYFARPDGSRQVVGSYGNQFGWALAVAFYKPMGLRGLMLGAAVRTSLTGSQPSTGGYEEGYYFNYVSVGPALKYYPFTHSKMFVKAEGGLGSVFTKNRYRNAEGAQNFFHQFGIGSTYGAGLGYSLTPFCNQKTSLDIQAIYQQFNTRVEVNGIGDDQWRFGSLNAGVALSF